MYDTDRPSQHTPQETELTIEKALEFAGDNSQYQKRRLLLISLVVLTTAILTAKVATLGTHMILLFLAASSLGQLAAPLYFTIDITAVAIFMLSLLSLILYPLSSLLTNACFILLGFFGRAFYTCSLIYLNEIGGERFRAWSLIVIFGIWGISVLLAAWENIVPIPRWIWYYALIFLPAIIFTRQLLLRWKPSPYHLFQKGLYAQARQVLNDMAEQNSRPPQQHKLQGQSQKDELRVDKGPSLYDLLFEPSFKNITIPLIVLWIYRQYIYFGSFLLMPQVSKDYGKNFILISISQTVAVLIAYPIRLKIRRVSTFFTLALIIAAASIVCSLTTVAPECRQNGEMCSSKILYRIALMLTRFSIALTGNILASYTLEVYPTNLKHLAHTFLLASSAVGSLLPSLNALLIQAGFSGFISFAILSVIPLYFTPRLPQTGGKINQEVFVDWQKRAPLIPLQNWNRVNF